MGCRVAWVVAAAASACTTVENDAIVDPTATLSEPVFRCRVEPILIAQCSYTACHGIADGALRVYSIGKLRAKPPADADAASNVLTDGEHHANYLSASGFAVGVADPADNWLLRKPLDPAAGGYEHHGGAIFASTTNASYMTIEAWLAGRGTCP